MIYECPACYLQWTDTKEPRNKLRYCNCSFCGLPREELDLLTWQMNHLNDVNPKKTNNIIRNFFRYFCLQVEILKESKDEKQSRPSKEKT